MEQLWQSSGVTARSGAVIPELFINCEANFRSSCCYEVGIFWHRVITDVSVLTDFWFLLIPVLMCVYIDICIYIYICLYGADIQANPAEINSNSPNPEPSSASQAFQGYQILDVSLGGSEQTLLSAEGTADFSWRRQRAISSPSQGGILR